MLSYGRLSKNLKTRSNPSSIRTPSYGITKLAQPSKAFVQARGLATGLPSFVTNVPATKTSICPNAMRVATEESTGETATVGVWIDAGSAYETAKNNGTAHFLEHMAFKGTTKRTKEQLEVEVENMGGTLNAYTSREQTVYYVKCFKNDVPKAVEILSDILQNSTLDKAAIESERGTILRESEEVNKDYGEVIFDHLHAAAYQGTPLARTILGSEDNIKSLQRDDLTSYIKENYHAHRMVLAGSGAVKHEQLVDLANKHFSALPTKKIDPRDLRTVKKPTFTGSMITIRDDTMDELHAAVAFQSVGWSHPDYFTFLVIQQIIGNWDRSIGGGKNLSSKLCEEYATHKLVNSLVTFNTCYNDTGLFGGYLQIGDVNRVEDPMYGLFREFIRIGTNVTAAEVERAKNRLKSSLLMSLDGTTAVCEDIGRQMVALGRRLPPAEIFLRIDSINAQDVMRVASQYFEDTDPAVVAIGPIIDFPDYNVMREWTYWRRL